MRARIETEMLWITIRTQEINFSVTTTTLGSRGPQLRPHEQVCAFSGRAFVFPASPTAHVISNFQYIYMYTNVLYSFSVALFVVDSLDRSRLTTEIVRFLTSCAHTQVLFVLRVILSDSSWFLRLHRAGPSCITC